MFVNLGRKAAERYLTQLLHEFLRRHHRMHRTVVRRRLQAEHHLAGGVARHQLVGQRPSFLPSVRL
jgi:hypothetical protein